MHFGMYGQNLLLSDNNMVINRYSETKIIISLNIILSVYEKLNSAQNRIWRSILVDKLAVSTNYHTAKAVHDCLNSS